MMTTNEIAAQNSPRQGPDADNYTASLLATCVADGTIPIAQAELIRQGFDSAFVETAEQFTSRESSTISLKYAKQLYSSVLYRADIFLLSLCSDDDAVTVLKAMPVSDILSRGQELISELHSSNVKIFRMVYKTRLSVPMHDYRFAVDKAFDMYFSGYSARFDGRNICTQIDYPLLGRQAYELTSEGAAFINEYYSALLLENIFCGYFAECDILNLLEGYGRMYQCPVNALNVNIVEVIVNNLVACMLIGKPPMCIELSAEDIAVLCERYVFHSLDALVAEMKKAFSDCPVAQENPRIGAYIGGYLPKLARELHPRIKSGVLMNFLVAG